MCVCVSVCQKVAGVDTEILQNSVNATHMDQTMQNYQLFQIIRWYIEWPKFLQVTDPINWAVQLTRGVFHSNIFFLCLFRIIRVPFSVFWSLHSWRIWCSRTGGIRRYDNSWCTITLRPFLTLILLTWRIWWAPNNTSRWQMEFNSAFKGLIWTTLVKCWIIQSKTEETLLF
jgi:hypothetical protein